LGIPDGERNFFLLHHRHNLWTTTQETRRDGSGSGSGQRTCGRSEYLTLYYGRPWPIVSLSKFSCAGYIRGPRYSMSTFMSLSAYRPIWSVASFQSAAVAKLMKFPVTCDVRFMCRGQENDSSPDSPMHTYRCIGRRYEKVFRPIKWVDGWRASPVSKARKCIGATEILRSSFWLNRTGSVPAKSRQQHIFPDPLAARSQRHHTDQLDNKWTYTLIGGTSSSPIATTITKC
jgi:hypothetical protein